jgi:hypothetical protein
MNEVRFRISISAEEFLLYYKGSAEAVRVTLYNGRVIQFPAGALVPYLDAKGVHGSFRVLYDNNNKLIRVERIAN